MERANIIQARHDEETTSLAKRQVGHGLSAWWLWLLRSSQPRAMLLAGLAGVQWTLCSFKRTCAAQSADGASGPLGALPNGLH